MAGTTTLARFAVKVLVEPEIIAPVRVGLEVVVVAVQRTAAFVIAPENADQAASEFVCGFIKWHCFTAGHKELVAKVFVVDVERLNDKLVERRPDRTTPVGVAAEHLLGRLARLVVEVEGFVADLVGDRMLFMVLGKRT